MGPCVERANSVPRTEKEGNNRLASVASWVDNPYKLVSLRETMELIDPISYLWLSEWSADLKRAARDYPDHLPFEDDDGIGLSHLKKLLRQCEVLGFKTTAHHLFLLIASIEADRRFSEIAEIGSDVHKSLFIELQTTVFFALQPGGEALYSEPYKGWETVVERFPKTATDIEEASKCLALNRATACVFHLMRVMEAGLYALADDLAIADVQENWQNAIDQIESAVRKLTKGDARKPPYSDVAAQFMHV